MVETKRELVSSLTERDMSVTRSFFAITRTHSVAFTEDSECCGMASF